MRRISQFFDEAAHETCNVFCKNTIRTLLLSGNTATIVGGPSRVAPLEKVGILVARSKILFDIRNAFFASAILHQYSSQFRLYSVRAPSGLGGSQESALRGRQSAAWKAARTFFGADGSLRLVDESAALAGKSSIQIEQIAYQ